MKSLVMSYKIANVASASVCSYFNLRRQAQTKANGNLVEFNDVRLRSPFSGTRDLAPAIAARLFKPKLYGSRLFITVENP